jgi:para-nitrobenzyl esterase
MHRRRFLYTGGAALAAYGLTSSCGQAKAGPLVKTAQGKIRGLDLNGAHGFYGIRYGESTAGARRFLPAAKPAAWSGEFEAFEFGPEAPQVQPHGEIPEVRATIRPTPMNEDCLRLNVWTPQVGAGKRPVMVWFHGGGYTSGNGSYWIYDGANMARRHDVVMVTLNHRLNSFGFTYLAHLGGEAERSANLGMMDCVAALEWVRDNIAAFGGDPSNVTIFGQSGGAGKVSTLLAMPSAQGLFHKAIVQSGSNPVGVNKEDAIRSAETFLAKVGAKTLAELQAMSMEQLLEANNTTQGLRLAPVVDGVTLPTDPFSPSAPAISASIPLLTGTTETEVTFFPNQPLDPIDGAELLRRVKAVVPKATDAQARNVIEMYRKGRPGISDIDLALIIESDVRFRPGVVQQAELKAAQPAPVYLYYFTWRTPVRDGKLKSMHTLEIPFVTANVDNATSMTGTGEDRYALEQRMSAAWAAFARTGNPNHSGLPEWPKFDPQSRATMIFDNECKVVNDPNGQEYRALMALRRA